MNTVTNCHYQSSAEPQTSINFANYQQNDKQAPERELCLIRWNKFYIAINLNLIASIKLTADIITQIKNNRSAEINLACFNDKLELIPLSPGTRKRVVVLNRIDRPVGILCDEISFHKKNNSAICTEIPASMQTSGSPIKNILRINGIEYYEIDLKKLCQLIFNHTQH